MSDLTHRRGIKRRVRPAADDRPGDRRAVGPPFANGSIMWTRRHMTCHVLSRPRGPVAAGCASALLACACAAVPTATASAEEWAFTFTPYLWFVRVDGDIATSLAGFAVDVELTDRFEAEDLVLATYAGMEWSRGRFGLIVDAVFTRVDVGLNSQVPPEVAAGLDATIYLIEATGAWTLHERWPFPAPGQPGGGNARLSLLAGARYVHLETEVAVSVDPVTVLVGLDTVDGGYPLVGLRFDGGFSDRVSFVVRADGMELSGDSAWNVAAGLSVHFRTGVNDASLFLGYRIINHNVDSGGSHFDITVDGAVLGWSIVFR
jgi:hypothetical protein